jgi:glycosyltransferase involved in cell wall biosynthesis
MRRRPAAFAVPGELTTLTGGYIYDRRMLEGLRDLGHDVAHVELGDSFPDPSDSHMSEALALLAEIEPERAVIIDGLAYGALDTQGVARIQAPIVAMVHHPLALESGLSPARSAELFRTERDNLALAAHVLVPSPHTAHVLSADYGVDPSRITIARPGTDRPEGVPEPADPPLILSVGIQQARKGHDVLLRALDRIGHLDWQAVIAGSPHDGAYAQTLTELHASLSVKDRVRLAGRVSAEELDLLYRQARIFALATRFEGYGIVFDEALSRGLPIISCRAGAVADTVPADAGILVAPDDPRAFANALEEVLANTERRHDLAAASLQAGRALPSWLDTASVAGEVLDALS